MTDDRDTAVPPSTASPSNPPSHEEAVEAARRIVEKHKRRQEQLRKQYPNAREPSAPDELIVARALLSREMLRSDAWQTMASAPKDGTRILLRCGSTITEGCWKQEISGTQFVDCWRTFAAGHVSAYWPDQWQPLPPSAGQAEAHPAAAPAAEHPSSPSRDSVLEEAAKAAEGSAPEAFHPTISDTVRACVAAIRALKDVRPDAAGEKQ